MCYEYYERLQRLEDKRRSELLERQERQTREDLEKSRSRETEWKVPEEPSRIREKVPA